MKRIVLFLATNLAVLVVLGIFLNVFGVGVYLTQNGIDLGALLVFSAIVGFTGSFISLLMSKTMAKWSTGAKIIDGSEGSTERWLVDTVRKLAERAQIGMPEVALYQGPPNAFATGAFKNSALVAVSTGLLESMNRDEVEAVLGHEVSHVANGDMVTLTLIQGVLNTFVLFVARVIASQFDRGRFLIYIALQMVFGVLASMIVAWFSRRREFRADAGGAQLESTSAMVSALERLRVAQDAPSQLPDGLAAFGIRGEGVLRLMATHPPLDARIARLQGR